MNEAIDRSSDEPDDELWDRALADAFAENARETAADDGPPQRIGPYTVVERIAKGGMGVVWRAVDESLRREIAVKCLRPDHADDPGLLERFLEEAQIGAQLRHPGLVPVHEIGLDARNRPFFTMELVEGKTLSALLAKNQENPPGRGSLMAVFAKVADTLAYAHSRNVLHRDLKPANIIVGAFGDVRVVDWGFAKVLGRTSKSDDAAAPPRRARQVATLRSDENSSSQSVSGAVLGTPAYMPPEQARGEIDALDLRADVFALGAILCEILTGEPPFPRGDRSAALAASQAGDVQAPLERLAQSGADVELVDLASRCLAADRNGRPADAGEVARALEAHAAAAEARTRAAQVAAAEARGRAEEERKSRRLAVALSSLVIVVIVAVAAFLRVREEEKRRSREEADGRLRTLLKEADRRLDAGDFAAARAALDRAREIRGGGLISKAALLEIDAVSERVRATVKAADEKAARAASLATARERMEFVLASPAMDLEDAEKAFIEAFDALGVDILKTESENSAARIGAFEPALQEIVVAALDDWSARRRNPANDGGAPRGRINPPARNRPDRPRRDRNRGDEREGRLAKVLSLIDPDPWRSDLRAAAGRADRDRLLEIARDVDFAARSPRSLELLGRSLARVGEPAQAARSLEKASTAHLGDYWLHHHLSVHLLAVPESERRQPTDSERERAIHEAVVAAALAPTAPNARAHLAWMLAGAGRLADAIETAGAGLRAAPTDIRLGETAARLHLMNDDPVGARAATSEATILRRAAEGVLRSIRHEDRETKLRGWLAKDAAFPGCRIALARHLLGRGAAAEAADLLGATDTAVELAASAALLVGAEIAAGRYDAAVEHGRAAIESGPSLGPVLEDAQALGDAARSLDRGDPVPSDLRARLARARVLLQRGEVRQSADIVASVIVTDIGALVRRGRPIERRDAGGLLNAAPRDYMAALVADGTPTAGIDDAESDRRARRRRDAFALFRLISRPPPLEDVEPWLHDPRLALVRDDDGLLTLPHDESESWIEAWSRLQ